MVWDLVTGACFHHDPMRGALSESCRALCPLLWAVMWVYRDLIIHNRERMPNAREDQWMKAEERWWSKIPNNDQAMAMLPAISPSGDEKAYAAEVASRKKSERRTKTLVQTPGWWWKALRPNASKPVTKINTVVQPCQRENGRWTHSSSLRFSPAWFFLTM